MASKTNKPLLILYSNVAQSVPAPRVAPPAKPDIQGDITKAVLLLRKGGDGGMPMALPASPPAMHARRTAPIAVPHMMPPAAPVMASPAPIGTSAAEKHLATGPMATASFTHDEMSMPDAKHSRQITKDPAELMQHAARHKEHLDNLIDRGHGVGSELGMHIVEGRLPTADDFAEGHRKGGMVVIAPLKGEKRMREKGEEKYNGDYSRMRDMSRASIAVSHPDDIPHVVHKLREAGMKLGSQPDDRFAKPTDAGYSDMQTEVVDPHGHRGELQIHSLDHLQAKEHGFPGVADGVAGHKMFEELRGMNLENPSPNEAKRIGELNDKSKDLYSEAGRRAASRTPRYGNAPVNKAVGMSRFGARNAGTTLVGRAKQMGEAVQHKISVFAKGSGHNSVPPHPNHRPGDGHQQMSQPGYFNFDGVPAEREHYGEIPKFFNGAEWKHVDMNKFVHEATRIPAHEFENMVAVRKHQHEQHVASGK